MIEIRPLAAIDMQKLRVHVGMPCGTERAPAVSGGRLDLDDVRAEIAEYLR